MNQSDVNIVPKAIQYQRLTHTQSQPKSGIKYSDPTFSLSSLNQTSTSSKILVLYGDTSHPRQHEFKKCLMPVVPLEQGRTRQLPQTALLKFRYEC
jgi:hypothetical protein